MPFIPVSHGFGQSEPNWLDGFRCGGTGADRGFGISSDGQGCSYLCGTFEGTVFLGGIAQASVGLSDILVAKLDYDGRWLWASRAGSTGFDGAQAIATDAAGNSYVVGEFSGTASFGPHRLTSKGGTDAFVAKLDSNGNWLWARSGGGPATEHGWAVGIDGSGNCQVAGSFEGTADFNGAKLYSNGGADVFVLRLNTNGDWQGQRGYGGTGDEYAHAIATDGGGNVVVAGYFTDPVLFGGTWLTSKGSHDVFVAKLDLIGNCLWARSAGGTMGDEAYGIAVDDSANCYLTGEFVGTARYGTTDLVSAGISDIFIAKLDGEGNWAWARRAGGAGFERGGGINTDGDGNVVVSGSFQETASFGTSQLTSKDETYDVFAVHLDAAGNWRWVLGSGGKGDELCKGISVDGQGIVHVAGYFLFGEATFGSKTLTSVGDPDMFVAKLSSRPIPRAPQNLTASRNGNNILLQWSPVTYDIRGEFLPLPVRYQVFWSPSSPAGPYSLLHETDATFHTHAGVLAQPRGFYRLKALLAGE